MSMNNNKVDELARNRKNTYDSVDADSDSSIKDENDADDNSQQEAEIERAKIVPSRIDITSQPSTISNILPPEPPPKSPSKEPSLKSPSQEPPPKSPSKETPPKSPSKEPPPSAVSTSSTNQLNQKTGATAPTPTKVSKVVHFVPIEAIDSSGNVRVPPGENVPKENAVPTLPIEPPTAQTSQSETHPPKKIWRKHTIVRNLLDSLLPSQGVTEGNSHDTWVTVQMDHEQLSPLELEELHDVVHTPTREPAPENPLNLGNPSEEWLANIEKLFIHFFLVMFDPESDASKVMMEMFPLERSVQIEGTFRILFKMDSEMYKDLEHVVALAQNWVEKNANKGPAQKKALHLIRHYREKVKSTDYSLLSTEQRLHNLRTFIQSLEDMCDLPKRNISLHNNFKRDTYGVEGSEGIEIKRPRSPRVKPGSHYARVVANILCDRPCGRPVTPPEVYADKTVKKFLKSEFIIEKELLDYTDNMYGAKYRKTDIFHQINPNLYRKKINTAHIIPVNQNCMLPIYTAGYLKKLRDGTCCPRRPRRKSLSYYPDGYLSPRGHYHKYKVLSDSSEEWEHDFDTGMRTKRKTGYTRGPYGGYVVGLKNYYEQNIKTKGDFKDLGGDKKRRHNDSDSDSSGRARNGRKSRRKDEKWKGKSKNMRNIDSDPNSLNWEHDERGKRTKRKYHRKRKLRNIKSDPNSELFIHDEKGRRTARKPGPLGDYYMYSTKVMRNIDSDPNSEGWTHDRFGNRVTRKARSKRTRRRQQYVASDSTDSDIWKYIIAARKSKKKMKTPRAPGKVRLRNIDSDPNSEGWEHDRTGRRTKRRPDYEEINSRYSHKRLRDIDSDSDSDAWEHDKKGWRTQRKPNVDKYSFYGHKPHRNIDTDSDSDNWEHDKRGNRLKEKRSKERHHRGSRSHYRGSPSHRRGSPSHRRGSPSYRRGSPSHRKGSPSYRRGSPSHRKGSPSYRRGSPSHRRGSPSYRRGSPSHRRGSPSYRRGSPSHRRGSPSYRRGSPSHRRGSPSYRRGSPSHHRDSPSYHRGSRSHHRGSRSHHRGSRSHQRGSRSHHKGSRSNRGDSRDPPQRKHFEYQKHKEHRIKDIKSDSDSDAWNHDRQGKRTKRKVEYKPRKSIGSDSDSDAWVHNDKGKRLKRVKGYKPRKSIASDSDSDAWEHNPRGRRIKRVVGYMPKKGKGSDTNSDNWNHDAQGARTDRVWKPKRYGGREHEKRGQGGSRSKQKANGSKKTEGMPDLYDKNGRRKDPKGRGGKDSDKLPHLGDGDQQKFVIQKAETKRSYTQLPPLGKNLKDIVLPQVNYKMKDHKPKKIRSDRRNTKYVTESLYKGYAMNSDSDDSFDGNDSFVPRFYQDDGDLSPAEDDTHHQPDDAGGAGDGISTCWELSEILFKSPFNKTLIPAPENILNYIKHLMPRCRWAKGPPIATRKFPNGALFCSMFENGSGLIFYPHGGLAVAISAPTPLQRVLVIRDPLDGFFFMDKSIMAEFNTIGHGCVSDANGTIHTQYNEVGGFHIAKRVDQESRRWLWNEGGIRLIFKLNKYIKLHVSKLDKIGLAFNGNKRGLYLNVGQGRKVSTVFVLDKKEELIGPKGKAKLRNPPKPKANTAASTVVTPSNPKASSVVTPSNPKVPSAVASGKPPRPDVNTSLQGPPPPNTAPSMTSQMDEVLSEIIEGKFSSSPTLTMVDKEYEG